MLTYFQKFLADNYVFVEDQEVMNISWFSVICYAFEYLFSLLKLLPQPCTILPPLCGLRNRGFEKFDCLPNISQLVKWQKWNLLCPGPSDSFIVLFLIPVLCTFQQVSFRLVGFTFCVLLYFPLALPLLFPQTIFTSDLACGISLIIGPKYCSSESSSREPLSSLCFFQVVGLQFILVIWAL